MSGGGEGRLLEKTRRTHVLGAQVAVLICCPRSLKDFSKCPPRGKMRRACPFSLLLLDSTKEGFGLVWFGFFKYQLQDLVLGLKLKNKHTETPPTSNLNWADRERTLGRCWSKHRNFQSWCGTCLYSQFMSVKQGACLELEATLAYINKTLSQEKGVVDQRRQLSQYIACHTPT